MTDSTHPNRWSTLNDVTVIETMLADKQSVHWTTCDEYIQYIVRTNFKNLAPDFQRDAVQDAMFSVHKNLATFRRVCKLTTWLTTVARTNAINHVRRQNEQIKREVPAQNVSEDQEDEIEHPAISTSKTPEETALINERIREIFAALEDFLKPSTTSEESKAWAERNRKIIRMVLFEGKSREETAKELGIPAANIGYMVRAAQAHLSEKCPEL